MEKNNREILFETKEKNMIRTIIKNNDELDTISIITEITIPRLQAAELAKAELEKLEEIEKVNKS